MVAFMRNWVTVIVVFFILMLAGAIFQPIIKQTMSGLVDQNIYDNSVKSGNNGDVSYFYHELGSAKTLVVGFFNLFFYIMAFVLLFFGVVSSLRRESGDYEQGR